MIIYTAIAWQYKDTPEHIWSFLGGYVSLVDLAKSLSNYDKYIIYRLTDSTCDILERKNVTT